LHAVAAHQVAADKRAVIRELLPAGPLRRHVEPVEPLFDLVESVVADLIVRSHGDNSFPGGTQRRPEQFALLGTCARVRAVVAREGRP